jgi:hypothetical protein
MSLSHLRNIFLCWHGLRIYFGSGYLFVVCRGVRGPRFSKKLQYLSVPHRVLQDSQESPGILRNPQESSGILRTHAGLHYDFADFKF